MRGALSITPRAYQRMGIIPAYAGSTLWSVWKPSASRDHPRVCGEHSCRVLSWWCVWGSSPRMRGAPRQFFQVGMRVGIIPAYAGSTDAYQSMGAFGRDHPRVCGEHQIPLQMRAILPGSSPRMRGAHTALAAARPVHGIIPTYAGNTTKTAKLRRFHFWEPTEKLQLKHSSLIKQPN